MLEELFEEAKPRKVVWYVDPAGGQGKTEFGKWFTENNNHEALFLTMGPKADMLYAIQNWHRVIFVNIARSVEHIDYLYGVLELIKDQRFLSTKYQPRVVRL